MFKLGDRVKIIGNKAYSIHDIGDVGTIGKIDKLALMCSIYIPGKVDFCNWSYNDDLKKISNLNSNIKIL